ncbi:helix-turn-helix domain-containing protein [Iocasia frigidifontis]|uniref:Helix-turn-helix domain-containing protein n=1 Tax=Iocasia fonsfrigidae TaxID=2682810 RepID=A0A8A7KBD5_9FIRM|nr:helix-turn-helix transcriptional regulator [Iocasia fonsfrigidae]QTL97405.1 helix-turn-helix domain-containing protein [Iocasia fonsfrigidae]
MIKVKVKDILSQKNRSIYWLSSNTNLTYPTLYRMVNQQTEGIQFHTLEEVMKALNITDFNQILELVDEEK